MYDSVVLHDRVTLYMQDRCMKICYQFRFKSNSVYTTMGKRVNMAKQQQYRITQEINVWNQKWEH